MRNNSRAKHSNNPKVLYYRESIQTCYKIYRILPCIYFFTLQPIVIFIIPAIPTFSEHQVTTWNFLFQFPALGPSHFWGWDQESGFLPRSGGAGPWSHTEAVDISNTLGASLDAGLVTGMWIGAPVPPLPSLCSSLPPWRPTGSPSTGGNCNLIFFLNENTEKKKKKKKKGILVHFVTLFSAEEEAVAARPSQ